MREARRHSLLLENGLALRGGLVAHVPGLAHEIAVVVHTIGDAHMGRVGQYFAAGQRARGCVMDGLGANALNKLTERAQKQFEADAHARALNASMPVSPGNAD